MSEPSNNVVNALLQAKWFAENNGHAFIANTYNADDLVQYHKNALIVKAFAEELLTTLAQRAEMVIIILNTQIPHYTFGELASLEF